MCDVKGKVKIIQIKWSQIHFIVSYRKEIFAARRSADQSAASGLNLCPDQLHVRIYVVFLLLQEKESL